MCSSDLLLADDFDHDVRCAVAGRPSLPEHLRERFLGHADPTIRAALVALCRATTGITVRDERTLQVDAAAITDALVVVDPGDATHGVARTLTTAVAFTVPVLVIPPAWRDALLAGALGDAAVAIPEIAAVVAGALAEVASNLRRVIDAHGPDAVVPFSGAGNQSLLAMLAPYRLWNALGVSRLQGALCGAVAGAGVEVTRISICRSGGPPLSPNHVTPSSTRSKCWS